MAITQDPSHKTHRSTDVSNGVPLLLAALSVICGFVSFVLCLAAEGSRTEATWYLMSDQGNGSDTRLCTYDASGRRPLAFAVGAFLLLVVAMFAEHACLLVVASPRPPALAPALAPQIPPTLAAILALALGPQIPQTQAAVQIAEEVQRLSSSIRTHTLRARNLFLTTWICFAIAEALLLIAMGVESSHLCQWAKPRTNCHILRPGLFAAAGVFGLLTVLPGIALYLTALRTHKLHQTLEGMLIRLLPSAPVM